MKITVYSTPTCPYCKMAKEYFKNKNLEYEDINVAEDDAKSQQMVKKSGQMGVPVVIIEKAGKEEVVIGFDQSKIDSLLV